MLKKRFTIAAALALVVVAVPVDTAFGAGTRQLPIHGSYSGTVSFTSATTVVFTGAGVAGRLGRGTSQGIAVVTGPDGTIPGGLDNVNTETFTAANGDTLTITSQDVAVPVAPGVTHGTGSWTVTGGTGRFLDATGSGTLDGYADFVRGVFAFQLNGTIATPNAVTAP